MLVLALFYICNMLKAIAIDDEADALEIITNQIGQHCSDIDLVDTCTSGFEGVKSIHTHKPDVIFLDVDMPQMTGFQMLEMFEEIDFEVIFTTAYDQYAVDAFRISAIGFLLKPIDSEELVNVVNHLSTRREEHLFKRHYDKLRYNLNQKNTNKQIAFPTQDGFEFIYSQEIVYCEADGNYTTIYLADGSKQVFSRLLKETETLIESYRFCRIHKSYLINLDHLKKYKRGDGGSVKLSNGKLLPVSRHYKEFFLTKIKQ